LNNWFYSHQTWEVALAICSVMVIVTLIGLYFFHRMVDWHSREKDTKLVGLSYALCGSVYTVLLAFVAVGAYETMDKTESITAGEADALGALAFDSAGLPADLALHVRADIDDYISVVTKKEWPSQRAYRMDLRYYDEGWDETRHLNRDLADFEPSTPGQATVKTEMERVSNELYAARRTRLLAASAHIPNAIWEMLIFGLLLIAVYVYLFGPHSFGIHMAVTALTMVTLGLVISLIIALDYPFRGDLSVDSEAYVAVQEVTNHIFEHAATAPSGAIRQSADYAKAK